MLAQGLRQSAKGDGRNGQVMHELRVAAQCTAGLADHVEQAARTFGAESAAGEEQPFCERVPLPRLELSAGFGNGTADASTEVLVRNVAAAIPH